MRSAKLGIPFTVGLLALGGCNTMTASSTHLGPIEPLKPVETVSERDVECMTRAMFFEANRSSERGMLAVGTVVMNRTESGRFPGSVCAVVGQKRQFAPGVMTRRMSGDVDKVRSVARRVLNGERLEKAGKAMFFHQQGLRFRYGNMRYTCHEGGNSFYEKTSKKRA